jgi:hypothetical protein
MKIKKVHANIKTLKVCLYCDKPLQKGIETKRGICMTCHNKYNIKTKITNWIK